jgi:hypothetical protein
MAPQAQPPVYNFLMYFPLLLESTASEVSSLVEAALLQQRADLIQYFIKGHGKFPL